MEAQGSHVGIRGDTHHDRALIGAQTGHISNCMLMKLQSLSKNGNKVPISYYTWPYFGET